MIKKIYRVESIKKSICNEWLLYKHYAKRLPMAIEYSFGLFKNNILNGVCVFGPTAPTVPITLYGCVGKYKIRELTRLVVNDGLEKNALSFFVAESLKKLPKPMTIISFADTNQGHHGYIYQATNWGYYGEGGGKTLIVDKDNKPMHNLTITDKCKVENLTRKELFLKYNITETDAKPKHRYLYFLGTKKDVKFMKKDLLIKSSNYPKGDNIRYDNSYSPTIQTKLF